MAEAGTPSSSTPSNPKQTQPRKQGPSKDKILWELEHELRREFPLARDMGKTLYVYLSSPTPYLPGAPTGVYINKANDLIKMYVKQNCWRKKISWAPKYSHQVVESISMDSQIPHLDPKPSLDLINVKNGLLDWQTSTLKPHSPDFRSPIQLPITYNPEAKADWWEKYAAAAFHPDCVETVWQIIAWLMVPYTGIQRCVLFPGLGSNGKSTFFQALIRFFGNANIATQSLQSLEGNKFSTTLLLNKLVNICDDLPREELDQSTVFRALTGNSEIAAEYKFGELFHFNPYARLIFSANDIPTAKDSNDAFFRRWLIIPMDSQFTCDTSHPTFVPLDEMVRRLTSEEQLSGVFNLALKQLPAVLATGIPENDTIQVANQTARESTDKFYCWADQVLEDGTEDDFIFKKDLFLRFREDFKGDPPVRDRNMFYRKIYRQFPDARPSQKKVDGKAREIVVGLKIKDLAS